MPSPAIRKITWGLDAGASQLNISIGSLVRGKNQSYKVSEILESKDTFTEYGYFEYYIYASLDGSTKDQFFWKRYLKKPDSIEYYFPDEKEEFFV